MAGMKSGKMLQEPVDEWDNEAIVLFSEVEDLQRSQITSQLQESSFLLKPSADIPNETESTIFYIGEKAEKYKKICDSRIKYFNSFEGKEAYPIEYRDLLEKWSLEKSTWDLVKSLYSLRISRSHSLDEPNSTTVRNQLKSELEDIKTDFYKIQKAFESDRLLAEFLATRTWLESTAPKTRYIETRSGYWPFTRKESENSHRKNEASKNLVSQLDPDAPTRLKKKLALEDSEYERLMFQSLYDYLRRGKLKDAMLLCINNGEPWRAASLRGGIYFFDNSLDHSELVASAENALGDSMSMLTGGNINRKLWQQMCSVIASDPKRDVYERSLYGILSGRLDEVLSVCKTWEDRVWAEISCMTEENLDQIIANTEEIYEAAKTNAIQLPPQQNTVSASCAQLFSRIKSDPSFEIRRQSLNPFREIQAALITNDIDKYIINYANDLRIHGTGFLDLQFLRFLVHLVLISRQSNQPIDEMAGDSIISSYVQALASSESHKALVAMYASKLPGSMPDSLYSDFLTKCDGGIESRLIYIQLAEQYKLNTNFIVKNTALRILESHYIGDLKSLINKELQISNVDETLTKEEISQIRAIEWLNFYPGLYSYSLLQVVGLLRRFLVCGRINAAISLFNSLPDDFVQYSWKYSAVGLDFANSGYFFELSNFHGNDKAVDQSKQWGQTLRQMYLIQENPDLDFQNSTTDSKFMGDSDINEDSEVQQWPTAVISTAFHEYIQILSLCDGILAYSRWDEHIKDSSGYTDMLEWTQVAVELTNSAENIIRHRVLETDWLGSSLMLFEENSTQTEQRNLEIELLRKQYIPDCLFKLHSLLFESYSFIPRNLAASLELAQIVADDAYNISSEITASNEQFPNGKMHILLQLIRKSALEMLKHEKSPGNLQVNSGSHLSQSIDTVL